MVGNGTGQEEVFVYSSFHMVVKIVTKTSVRKVLK